MGRDELIYAKKLLRVRIGYSYLWVVTVAVATFFTLMILLFSTILNIPLNADHKESVWQNMPDTMGMTLLVVPLILLFCWARYERGNRLYDVYPHTVSTLFLSRFALDHLIAAGIVVFAFVLHLIQTAGVAMMRNFRTPMITVTSFDWGASLTALCVTMVYALVIAAIVALFYALFRRFPMLFGSFVVAFVANSYLYVGEINKNLFVAKVIGFFTEERSLPLFFVKIIALWALCSLAAYRIDRTTDVNKSDKWRNEKYRSTQGMILPAAFVLITVLNIFNAARLSSVQGQSVVNDIVTNRAVETVTVDIPGVNPSALTVTLENVTLNQRTEKIRTPSQPKSTTCILITTHPR